MSALDDLIEDLEDWLDDAQALVGNETGELSEPTKGAVATDLTEALAVLDEIIDHPDLSGGVGGVLSSYQPQTTNACATDCCDLAANIKVQNDSQTTGWKSRLLKRADTIADIIMREDGYRDLAGIT